MQFLCRNLLLSSAFPFQDEIKKAFNTLPSIINEDLVALKLAREGNSCYPRNVSEMSTNLELLHFHTFIKERVHDVTQ